MVLSALYNRIGDLYQSYRHSSPALQPSQSTPTLETLASYQTMPNSTSTRKKSGFSLIELLVGVAIVGTLSAIAIPQLLGAREKARNAQCDRNFTSLASGAANYLSDYVDGGKEGEYASPVDNAVADLVDDVGDDKSRNPRNRNQTGYFLVRNNGDIVRVKESSCAVGVGGDNEGIIFYQVAQKGETLRTFRVNAN